MPFTEKILWVVNYSTINKFIDRADRAGATAVAIRTDNKIETAIQRFHAKGVKVYGWRWPSAQPHRAMMQAEHAARLLREAGMDGYFVDPEGAPDQLYDWDRNGLESLADDFCQTVREGNPAARFGVTSHFKARLVHPRLPFATFFAHADVLLRQVYWRVAGGNVAYGNPAENYRNAFTHWTNAGGSIDRIVPMAGEIALTTAAKIEDHADAASEAGRTELHFYTALPTVPDAVWTAIRSA